MTKPRSPLQHNKFFAFCLCLCLLLAAIAAEATGMRPYKLRVGFSDSPGFIERMPNGTIDGYGVAYLDEIAYYTGWSYEYVPGNWQQCLTRLEKGEIDILGMAQYTPEHAEKFDYASLPSGVEYMVMYVRGDDNSVYYNDYQSFNGLKIGVLKGNYQTAVLNTIAKKNTFNYTPVFFNSGHELEEALNNKQVDAIVTGSMPLYKGLRLVGRFQADPIYFITTKGNTSILNGLNDAQMNIRANSPEFENNIYQTYYSQSSLATQPLLDKNEKSFLASQKNIVIGFLPNDMPLAYTDSKANAPAGILIRLLQELEHLCNVKVTLKPLPTGADFTTSIRSGDYDLIAGVIDADPYRSDIVNMRLSKPFFHGRVMAVADRNKPINLKMPLKIALPFNFLAYRDYISKNYPHFTIVNKSDTQTCLQAVASGEADLTLQNSHVISYHLQNPQFENLQVLSLFNFPDNLCLAAPNTPTGNKLLTILNKSIDTISGKTVADIIISETTHAIYKPTFIDLLHKYHYHIGLFILLLTGLFSAWFYFNRQRQKYLLLLEQKNQELEQTAQQALSASQAKSSFLSRMSHEIRTPLNAILGFSSLADSTDNKKLVQEYLQKINYSSTLLLGIVNDILDMSAIEKQKLKLDASPFDLNNILEELAHLYELQCRERGISFQLHRDYTPHSCLIGDSLRLQQILNNLLSNAIKFTESSGKVILNVTVQPAPDDPETAQLTLMVADTGCGMSKSMLKHVFQPFEQEDGSTARKYGGSGLGLSIVKSLVEMMRGNVSVSSIKGSGTTFTIDIVLPYSTQINSNHNKKSADLKRLKGLKILLAEDNPLNQELCLELLKNCGINATCAVNGEETVRLFQASTDGTFDLILMDIQMPVMDGYEAARQIRVSAHPQAATIPIIALSADAFAEDIKRALSCGMSAHVAKPIVPEELYQTMLNVLTCK